MGWFGKVVGGVLGAAVGGPVGAGIGAALGAAFDEESSQAGRQTPAFDQDDDQVPARISWIDDEIGRFLVVQPEVRVQDGFVAVVRFRRPSSGDFVGGVPEFADSDGDFVTTGVFDDDEALVYVPFGALQTGAGDLTMEVVYLEPSESDGQAVIHGHSLFDFNVPRFLPWRRVAMAEPLVRVAMELIAADGPLKREEVAALRDGITELLELESRDQADLQAAMKLGPPTDRTEALRAMARRFRWFTMVGTVHFLADIARADGSPNLVEIAYIRELAISFGCSPSDWPALAHEAGLTEPKDFHQVLGLAPGASAAEVKAAYRSKITQYHPDRVASLPREFQELANQKSMELREAYEALIASHGGR